MNERLQAAAASLPPTSLGDETDGQGTPPEVLAADLPATKVEIQSLVRQRRFADAVACLERLLESSQLSAGNQVAWARRQLHENTAFLNAAAKHFFQHGNRDQVIRLLQRIPADQRDESTERLLQLAITQVSSLPSPMPASSPASSPASVATEQWSEGALASGAQSETRLVLDAPAPTIPNFTLLDCVGQGGFGRVFRASRHANGEIVAIKLLHAEGTRSDRLKQRFLREATVLCQLKHPNIIGFRELGIAGNDFYLVMDFCSAISWNDLTRGLAPTDRIQLATQVIHDGLNALVYIHQQNIVHRDLKPSNILLESDQDTVRVRLGDFGLAKDYSQAGNSGMTSEQVIAGTLGYLAPELLAGVKYFRPASDQYALAATLYQMLADRRPITIAAGSNPLIAIRQQRVPRIESLLPEISPALAEWLHRGLHPDPNQRFESTEQMLSRLQRVSELAPGRVRVPARPGPPLA